MTVTNVMKNMVGNVVITVAMNVVANVMKNGVTNVVIKAVTNAATNVVANEATNATNNLHTNAVNNVVTDVATNVHVISPEAPYYHLPPIVVTRRTCFPDGCNCDSCKKVACKMERVQEYEAKESGPYGCGDGGT